MIAIVNKNNINNKFLPQIALVKDTKTLKKECKKQLMTEIIENPNSLVAYKAIEVYKVAEVSEEMEIKKCDKTKLFTYEELFKEIVKEIVEQLKKGE